MAFHTRLPRPPRQPRLRPIAAASLGGLVVALAARGAGASPPTPGYPEAVVQWGVQKGETCEDIAQALYGSARYVGLLQRYNQVVCKPGAPLREGITLVVPEKPTTLPDARLRSMNPDVRARPGGGGWAPAAAGMPLFSNANVNTLDQGRADIQFIDRTRVFLAPNTLVVIYGTANQTRVSKSAPVAVEVESGEVKAGLAALRGDAVEVGVKGGGRVSAASRDTVVQRKGERTTVEVFDGKAGVASGGKSVDVPTNYGTRFVGRAPPVPPRPLPPAPAWASGGTAGTALAPGGVGTITAAWDAVPDAIAYRVELSRDEGFHDLVAREEVPAAIHAFRAEKLPIGTYWLTVRAIDKEEYLGIAATARQIRLIDAKLESGQGVVAPSAIEANPYGMLHLSPSPQAELAIDDGPFFPMPDVIDLRLRAPHELRIRRRGSDAVDVIPVRYTKVGASIQAAPAKGGRSLDLHVRLTGLDGVDVPVRVRPTARVRLHGVPRTVALTAAPDGTLTGSLPLDGPLPLTRIDVVDDRGAVLGTVEVGTPVPAVAAPPLSPVKPLRVPILGAYAPLWQASPSGDVLWFAPTPPDGAALSAVLVRSQGVWGAQGQVRASGSVGPLGLAAELRSNASGDVAPDASGWLGGRLRVLRLDGGLLEVAPALRVGIPASSKGMPAQVEPAVAVGGVVGRFTWLADVGGRLRVEGDINMTGVPTGQAFLLAGGTMDVLSWLRLNAALDGHIVVRDGGSKNGVGGIGFGLEGGRAFYGGLSLHLSPWSDPGFGPFMGQLAVGFRASP